MKKRKKERQDARREEKKKEWEKVRELQEMEKIYDLLNCHFDLSKYMVKSKDGGYGIDLKTAIDDLTCEECSHFMNECKGKELKGESVMNCLMELKHEHCMWGGLCGDDWEDLEELEKEDR